MGRVRASPERSGAGGLTAVPKIVDREARREQVVQATWRLVARVGIDRVSIRDIAAEAGYSTGVLGHYFRDKDEILRTALQQVWERERTRIAQRTEGVSGLAALRAIAAAVLPVDADQTLEMTVWINFWSRAFGDAGLAEQQRSYYAEWRSLLRRHFDEAIRGGEVRPGLRAADEATRLAALIDGLGIQAVFEAPPTPRRRALALATAYLDELRPVARL